MSLNDLIAADLSAVFFNTDDFAKLHNVNGTDMLCIVDTDMSKERSDRQGEQYDGIFLTLAKLHVKKTDLPKRPVFGKVLRLDEKQYIVADCADEDGVWVITLGLNDG